MEYLKLKYREKEYLLDELIQESNELMKSLILPNEFRISNSVTQWGLINDVGYAIAGEKFCDLHSVLASARFALYNSHLKIHKNEISWKAGYISQLWLRSQFLKNSIIWYNSCEDYFLQIIWFAFDFFKDLSKYEKEMQLCRFEKITKTLEKETTKRNTLLLLNKLNDFHNNKDVKYIRELSNLLKHKQNINIKDLDNEMDFLFTTNEFSSKFIEKKLVDVDEAIISISNVHVLIVEFGLFLLDFISFNEMFVINKEDQIQIDSIKKKKDYKKIIVKELYFT